MRLLVTADLHYNHRHSRPLADDLIDRLNREAGPGDAVLVVGDTAAGDGPELEECLARFQSRGPKLFVAGNHELWTRGPDSHRLFSDDLPRRVEAAGWHWLEERPVILEGGLAVAGSIGWYDYRFALPHLGIPRRFYEQKISPAAAVRLSEYAYLLETTDDISPAGMEVAARWNDGRHVRLHRSDEHFLAERMAALDRGLASLAANPVVTRIVVGVHHVPFVELMPPRPAATVVTGKAFAGAFLGSPAIGEMLLRHAKLTDVLCGHSHFAARAQVGHIRGVNIGSGYRVKSFEILELR